mmetsp:Transcript_8559/g.20117  ORF Transcript_8559/g.20117 Transcript_8559/m.20117 type:complete len:309 (+) Transcript_8559:100-1026(+)
MRGVFTKLRPQRPAVTALQRNSKLSEFTCKPSGHVALQTTDPEGAGTALRGLYSAEGAVPSLPQDLHHGSEGKPLGDLLACAETAAELSAGELHYLLALLLGHALLHVALRLAHVDHVLVVRDCHAQLVGELLAHLLRVVGPIEVIARDGALGACHVAANDEVRGSEVLPDDHVLDGLARARHLHAVGQVGPAEHGVLLLGLFAESLVGADAHDPVDVTGLRGSAGGVDEQHGVLDVTLSALQELKVGTVDWVSVLESNNILALRQPRAHFCGRLHQVLELGAGQAVQLATNIVRALFSNERVDGGVL